MFNSVSVATLLKTPRCKGFDIVLAWSPDSRSIVSCFSASLSWGESAAVFVDPKQLSVLPRDDLQSLLVERSHVDLLCNTIFVLAEHLWNSGRNVARLAAMIPKAPSIIVQIKGFILLL